MNMILKEGSLGSYTSPPPPRTHPVNNRAIQLGAILPASASCQWQDRIAQACGGPYLTFQGFQKQPHGGPRFPALSGLVAGESSHLQARKRKYRFQNWLLLFLSPTVHLCQRSPLGEQGAACGHRGMGPKNRPTPRVCQQLGALPNCLVLAAAS
ncbi:hypothetical protein KIL84_002265 [Mauremys mutica]|uniref:Uncharacterized protein n=1 Tax=Mauremys mutica TaxID=74926 RepID=A0A9D4AZ36_9SAUR|nr:hypothetical protein KIL84_002265 [Mauremys mutica]